MKKLFLLTLFYIGNVYAQKPETVYSIALEVRENSWYEQQLKLWKDEAGKNKQNGIAWTNYYMAARALRNLSGDSPEKQKTYQKLCAEIVDELHKSYPDSFEDYYLSFLNSGNPDHAELLLKAAAINPTDERIIDEMLIHNAIVFDQEEFERYSTEMFKRNQLPAALLNWGHNILSELDENAILFTFGDNDTYAAWVNQGALGFRKDVTVINTSLILMDDYRNKLFKQLGLSPFAYKLEESADYEQFASLIYEHIFSGTHPVYVSNSGVASFPEQLKNHLYLVGLSHQYGKTSLETTDLIVRNYENRYLLDYLKTSFSWHFAHEKSKEFNSMYLPSLVKLYWHYKQTEQQEKCQKTKLLLLKIAEESGRKAEVEELLKPENKNNTSSH